ncbi:Patatin/Phospholipase A2-related domain and Acyl transferase/acyl hydrolase/lysophospholipase domain-containing protein [Strongyloides ratti]|uniref:Patatin/Phospholipase A2-related domain and Acyl transferase/acyl hydrolase/lysophospholipase domain-containing protein n=1 Tax=Strongyloides ratti TaxID=34506 RepID=A0A090MZY4_STRRB|nr:Patatin/Phospholipase A2-related domain and Acyl transferase/acyl hydrolase/lysophospholipase domain-containing protein [Strongyloides ratti]CEF69740.1 Patatin/Phospholipase A2-related domain and Acyl transferase/acyl hydrolase/lysophospholipase domain-containing protein [Strongyloides ratti]
MDETKNEKVFDGGDKENNINRKNINLEKEKKDTGSINNNNHNNNLSEISEDTVTDNDSYVTFLTQGNNIGSFYKRKNHKPLPPKLALSFSGAGFLGIYHFGVIHCLQAYAPTLVSKVQRYAGTSAGSIIASLLAISPEIFNKSMKLLIQMADETNTLAFGALTNGFSMHEKLVRAVDEVIPDNVSSLKDRLYISMTNAKTNQNILYSNFTTKEQLTAAICASCYIPGWSAHFNAPHPVVDGVSYIDGGFSNNLPVFDDMETITISPFSGGADIAPIDNSLLSSYLPMQITFGKQMYSASFANIQRMGYALFPPKGEALKMYYDLGFKDAFLYLYESGRLERPNGTKV